ncbi:MAG TPA: hypothetical protein P5322_07785 [Spirochaetota bacterium]|nr:hypothetical protein [Spirochaetota bacterium]
MNLIKKNFRKIVYICMIVLLLNGCLTLKINKDSPPLADFGVPLIGHYRNGDTVKAALYTVLFVTSMVGVILFAPTQGGGSQPIIPIDRTISDPIYYSLLGCALTVPIASSIDGASTYHLVNKKIIDLNGIPWDPKGNITKYDAINQFRQEQEERFQRESDANRIENYREDIELYRKKLLDGTITDDELTFVEKSTFISEELKNELGYYYINKKKLIEQEKNKE